MPNMLMNFTTNTENISSHVKKFSLQFKIDMRKFRKCAGIIQNPTTGFYDKNFGLKPAYFPLLTLILTSLQTPTLYLSKEEPDEGLQEVQSSQLPSSSVP